MLVFDICRSAICQCGVQSLSLASSGLRRHPMTCTPMAYWSRWVSPYRFCISKAALFREWDCTKASTSTLRSVSSTTTAWKRLTSLRHLRLSEASPQVREKDFDFPRHTQTISATLPSTRPYRTFCLHRMTCQSRRSLSEGTDPMLVRRKLIIILPVIWVCLKIGYTVYTPNYSHLMGIMISKTIGFRGTQHFQTHPYPLISEFRFSIGFAS